MNKRHTKTFAALAAVIVWFLVAEYMGFGPLVKFAVAFLVGILLLPDTPSQAMNDGLKDIIRKQDAKIASLQAERDLLESRIDEKNAVIGSLIANPPPAKDAPHP